VKAIAPALGDRFQSAEDMQMALEEWLMTGGKLVTASDVAKCVKDRLSPEVRARNDALMSQNRALPDVLMSRLVIDNDSETPTAGSGLVTAPPSLWVGQKTKLAPSRTGAATEAPTETGVGQYAATRAPIVTTGASPARPSDATQVVRFVPVSVASNAAATENRAPARPSEPAPLAKPARRRLLLLSLAALAALVLIAIWLARG
jgi:hypothetical protein